MEIFVGNWQARVAQLPTQIRLTNGIGTEAQGEKYAKCCSCGRTIFLVLSQLKAPASS
jgi:hypothetical protein